MSRRLRPNRPGHVFHLTSRTIRHVKWFESCAMRDRIAACLRDSLPKSDAELLAYAIMPNHLHLIVRQGAAPLAALMQPLCQSIAFSVHRRCQHEGYVFERRFRDKECITARHLRNAIVYTHHNPKNAGLCSSESRYRWTSYRDYLPQHASGGPSLLGPLVLPQLRLFAVNETTSPEELKKDYERYSAWAMERRRCKRLGHAVPPVPDTPAGDRYWLEAFVPRRTCALQDPQLRRPDLCDLADSVLHELTPGFTIAQLRFTRGGPQATLVRHAIISRALHLGFRGSEIARYLHISSMTISRVKAQLKGPCLKAD